MKDSCLQLPDCLSAQQWTFISLVADESLTAPPGLSFAAPVTMAGPSLSTLSELQEQLAKFRRLTDKELSKETACNVELVARYQKERELLRAEIDRQTPGDVQYHGAALC